MLDEIEVIYLTHHFHGHKKFHSFAIPGGDGCEFHWSDDVGDRLHEAVAEILELETPARKACEVIHFEMDEQAEGQSKRLHYVVVYHPGKMKTLRQMKGGQRDLMAFIPALEATMVYDPLERRIHVLSNRPTVAKQLADCFAQVGFERPLSREPVNALRYNLSVFQRGVDWGNARAPGVRVVDAWMSLLTVALGHTQHTLTLSLAYPDDVWQVSSRAFGTAEPLSRSRRVTEAKLSFRVVFDGEENERALDLTVSDQGTSNLLSVGADRKLSHF